MAKPTGLFLVRFQPFHNGHMLVIQGMTKMCGRIVVAICSANKSNTADEPFTAAERRDMMQRALQAKDIIPTCDVVFIEVPDMASDEEWVKKTLELCEGPVQQVWTGNERTKKSFEGKGLEVKWIKEVPGLSATEVRKRIKAGGDWKALVPEEVAASINAIEGVARIKK